MNVVTLVINKEVIDHLRQLGILDNSCNIRNSDNMFAYSFKKNQITSLNGEWNNEIVNNPFIYCVTNPAFAVDTINMVNVGISFDRETLALMEQDYVQVLHTL